MLGFGRGRKDGINPRLWKLRENPLHNRRILLFFRNKPQCVRIVLGFCVGKKNKKYFSKNEKSACILFWIMYNTNYDDAPFVSESSRTRPTKAKCGRLYLINPPRHPVEARVCVLSTNSAPCGQRWTKCVDKLYRCWRESTLAETPQIVAEPRISTK